MRRRIYISQYFHYVTLILLISIILSLTHSFILYSFDFSFSSSFTLDRLDVWKCACLAKLSQKPFAGRSNSFQANYGDSLCVRALQQKIHRYLNRCDKHANTNPFEQNFNNWIFAPFQIIRYRFIYSKYKCLQNISLLLSPKQKWKFAEDIFFSHNPNNMKSAFIDKFKIMIIL